MLREWISRARFFLAGKSRYEVDEEIQFHIERQVEAYVNSGMPLEEARRAAALDFGGRERTRERCRRERPSWPLEAVLRELRYAIRGLLRNPGFATVAVMTLALGIGANSAVFSLLNQALIRTLPVEDPEHLVVLSFAGANPGHIQSNGGSSPGRVHEFSYPMYRDLRDKNEALSGLIAAAPAHVGVVWNQHAEAVSGELVSGNYFQVLGVKAAAGRVFDAEDETAEEANPVAVLSFDYWKTHLAEAQVVGKTLLVNGKPFTVVGVSAPGFQSMVWGNVPAVFVPITMQKTAQPDWAYLNDRQAYWLDLIGRLRPGWTGKRAEASLSSLFISLRRSEFPLLHDQSENARKKFIDASHLNVEAGARGFSPLRSDVEMPLAILMGMALLVVAMAVVNVASLLLVRAAGRVREFTMRYALGATKAQIVRQLLIEGLLLGAGGAAMGLLVAPPALRTLIHWMSGRSPAEPVFSPMMDWRVVVFTTAATLTASLLFSLAPAIQFWNPRLAESLKLQTGTGTGGSLKFRRSCVALQIGFSLMLIVAAGFFVQTMRNLRNVDTGFPTDHLITFNLAPEMAGYPAQGIVPAEERVLDAISALPGVHAAGATNDADLVGDEREGDVIVSGYTPKPDEEFDVEVPWVSPGYLQTLGIPLVAGRAFTSADTATSQKVAVVNEKFAKHFFGSTQAALGHHVSRPRRPKTDAVIVGVVKDVKHTSVRDRVMPTDYTLFSQAEKPTGLTYYVRTWQKPEAEANSIRAAIAEIDPRLIVSELSTMEGRIDDSIVAERMIALLAATFGALATVLAGIGLYGILAYSTAQRTREIGIRMALGAQRTRVVGLILRDVLTLAAWSVGCTIPLAVLAARVVRSQLFGVSIADPRVYGLGVLVIGVVAVAAGFLP